MRKESKMIKLKEEMVKERSKLVLQACEECLDSSIEVTYRTISDKTNIPIKTLQRNPYKNIVFTYRDINEEAEKLDRDLILCREQIKYLKDVIKQLNKENHELKTRLFIEGII